MTFIRQAASAIALAHKKGLKGLEQTVPAPRKFTRRSRATRCRSFGGSASVDRAGCTRQRSRSLRSRTEGWHRHADRGGAGPGSLGLPASARAVWLQRINQPGLATRSWTLAIQGLAFVHDLKAIPRLRVLVLAPDTGPIVRIEAAKALGALQTSGLEQDAERLAVGKAGAENASHIAAAELLRRHRGAASAKILERLALEAEPAAAWIALEGLLQDDPRRVVLLLPKLKNSPDAGVRERCVEGFRKSPSMVALPLVGDLMDDLHPLVRISARKALADVAKTAEFRDAVLAQATRQLTSDSWRALEQATILTVNLDRKAAAPRLVQLLQFPRPEVFVAAAWGLRKLAVPATLPGQLREVERRFVDSEPERSEGCQRNDRRGACSTLRVARPSQICACRAGVKAIHSEGNVVDIRGPMPHRRHLGIGAGFRESFSPGLVGS